MKETTDYDVAVIGGGVSGISLAILLAKRGFSVALFEKSMYPFHRVCGEYISMESVGHLKSLGVNLDDYNVPKISKLRVTTEEGDTIDTELPLGGIGLSRFTLDYELINSAFQAGVDVWEKTTVQHISFSGDLHTIVTNQGAFTARVVAGAFGKKSGLDKKLARPFMKNFRPQKNYVGIKYHIRASLPANLIGLHAFKGGYCGISKIEGEDTFCLCYLTTEATLKSFGGDIRKMEREVLMKNPHLKEIFSYYPSCFKSPVVISQVHFLKKEKVHDHVIMVGDAAAFTSPLSGNGMSVGFHSAVLAAEKIKLFLCGVISREAMEKEYAKDWSKTFSKRFFVNSFLQGVLLKPSMLKVAVKLLKAFPRLNSLLIKNTHGVPFHGTGKPAM